MQNPHYQSLGGEQALRDLVHAFYRQMDTLPEAAGIRAMHPDLAQAEEKLFMFLSGWLGGPQLYVEQYGHPRMRQRHMHVAIGEDERDQWMLCMRRAMEEVGVEEGLRAQLDAALFKVADFMRNQ